MAKKDREDGDFKVVAVNKKARFEYEILEVLEAGMALSGAEIKSVRAGGVSLGEAYVRPQDGEMMLVGAHIREYEHSREPDYDPVRKRKLLLHRREIRKLTSRVEQKGLTIVPLRIYLKKGLAKLEIALARGKAAPDKRSAIIDRERRREAERAMKRR